MRFILNAANGFGRDMSLVDWVCNVMYSWLARIQGIQIGCPVSYQTLPHGTAVAKATLWLISLTVVVTSSVTSAKIYNGIYDLWTWFLCRPRIKNFGPSQRPQNCPRKVATQNRKIFWSINDWISSLWLLIYGHIRKEHKEIFWSPFQCVLGFLCSFRLISGGTTIFLLAVALSSEVLLLLKIVTSLDKRNPW